MSLKSDHFHNGEKSRSFTMTKHKLLFLGLKNKTENETYVQFVRFTIKFCLISSGFLLIIDHLRNSFILWSNPYIKKSSASALLSLNSGFLIFGFHLPIYSYRMFFLLPLFFKYVLMYLFDNFERFFYFIFLCYVKIFFF